MENNMNNELDQIIHIQEEYLQGRVLSIRISSVLPINCQSCDVQEVILEYEDKTVVATYLTNGELGAIHLTQTDKDLSHIRGRQVVIEPSDIVIYNHSTYENGELDSLSFTWNDTWLHIFRMEYDLAFTRSSFDLTSEEGWPSKNQEPHLMWK